jgi:tetratricopeptide (TPR) repeat protein
MVSWSYELLSAREKLIFERLSVFASAFGRDAVAAICGDELGEVEVVDVLSNLVSKSLVSRRDDGSPRARFRLLHLIRQYARDRFEARPDAETIRERYAEYFCRLAEDAAVHFVSHDQHEWLSAVDRELNNVRRAMTWAVENRPELALRMVAALGRWCYLRGRYTDGRGWAADALRAAPDAPSNLLAPALQLAATLAFLQCDYADARAMAERAHDLYRRTDDRAGVAWSTARLGSIARELGDYDRSDALHRAAMTLARDAKDAHGEAAQLNYLCFVTWIRGRCREAEPLGRQALNRMRALGDSEGVIWALINLGAIARYTDDLDGADLLLGQCLDLCEDLSFREGIGWVLNQLGAVTRLRGDSERALGLQRASLAEHRLLGDRWREASVYDELAAIAVQMGDPAEAARELAAADRLRLEIAVPVPAVEREERDHTAAAAQLALGRAYELTGLTAGLGPHHS